MKYVDTLIQIEDTVTGPAPVCTCGWRDLPFYKVENAWHSAILHLAYDSRHAGTASSAWANQELGLSAR